MFDLTTIRNRHGILSVRVYIKYSHLSRNPYNILNKQTRINIENINFLP